MLFIFLGLTEYIFVEDREVIFYMLIIWYFATHGLAVPTYIIEEEILDQTIINIIQSGTSLFAIIVQRSVIKIIIYIVKAVPLFTVLYFIGDYSKDLFTNFPFIMMVFLIAVISSYGLGIIISGFALIYKRISNFVGLTHYYILFFGGITLPIKQKGLELINQIIFPFIQAKVIISNLSPNSFDGLIFGFFFIQCVLITVIAYFTFQQLLSKSMEKGELYGI